MSYKLILTNKLIWELVATEGAKGWLEKLACIMQLKESNSKDKYEKVIIFRNGTSRKSFVNIIKKVSEIGDDLPLSGWHLYNLNLIQFIKHNELPFLVCDIGEKNTPEKEYSKMNLFLQLIYEKVINSGGLPIHGALIEKGGEGIIIGGDSTTGKSTCCKRIPYPWKALCDELVIIIKDEQEYMAHPFPTWSDYICRNLNRNWNVEKSISCKKILFLKKSNADKLVSIKPGIAALNLTNLAIQKSLICWTYMSQTEIRKQKLKVFDNAWNIVNSLLCFNLEATLHGKFWEEIEKVI